MAQVSQLITLGIGTPSDIPYFLTVGLGIGVDTSIAATPDWIVRCAAGDYTVRPMSDDTIVRVPPDDTTGVL